MGPLKISCAVIALSAILGPQRAHGGEVAEIRHATLTLKQSIAAAFGLSPALKAEQFDIDAAGKEIIRQRTALLPSVTASIFGGLVDGYPLSLSTLVAGERLDNGSGGGITRNPQAIRPAAQARNNSSANSAGDLNRADWAPYGVERIQVDYPLFQNGSILGLNDAPAIAGARANQQGLEWTRKLGEEKVVFDICNAFFIAQWFQVKVAREEARVHFSRQRLEIFKSLFNLQIKLKQDVQLAEASLTADEQLLAATRQSVRDSYAVLATLVGKPAAPVLRVAPDRPIFSSLPPLDDLVLRAREQHPNVGVQQSVADFALARLKLDQASLWPQATFNTSYAVGENFSQLSTNNVNNPTRFATGVAVNIPIFDWGSRLAAVRESRLKLLAEQARTAQTQMDVAATLARLYGEQHELESQLGTLAVARVAMENAAKLARQQREIGMADQLTTVEAELALLTAEDAVEGTRLQIVEKYAALQQAAGGAWNWAR